tara:strand:- start:14 stop:187 length:174 start_codon:yes stop_codon:yes gene_type:complete
MTRSALAAAGRSEEEKNCRLLCSKYLTEILEEEKLADSSAPNTKQIPNQMNHVDLTD